MRSASTTKGACMITHRCAWCARQSETGMAKSVREAMHTIMSSSHSGSMYVVMYEARLVRGLPSRLSSCSPAMRVRVRVT